MIVQAGRLRCGELPHWLERAVDVAVAENLAYQQLFTWIAEALGRRALLFPFRLL